MDSFSTSDSWTPIDDAIKNTEAVPYILSAGFLLKKDKRFISLALSWDAQDNCVNSVITIPRKCIVSIKEVY